MQAIYISISATKKLRSVKYQFPYRDVYLSCVILGMSLLYVQIKFKMKVAEVVQEEKDWEREGNPQILQ